MTITVLHSLLYLKILKLCYKQTQENFIIRKQSAKALPRDRYLKKENNNIVMSKL